MTLTETDVCCVEGVIKISSLIKSAGQLTHLSLSDNKITPQGVVAVAAMLKQGDVPSLEYLSLRDNLLDASAVKSIEQMILPSASYKGLLELSLEANALGEEGGQAIFRILGIEGVRLLVLAMDSTGIGKASTSSAPA